MLSFPYGSYILSLHSILQLMPYVSLRCPDNTEEPVTAKEIFDACLAPQITENFKSGFKDKSPLETMDAEER